MSGGRVDLGLGTGWFDQEHTAYGIPFPSLGSGSSGWRSSWRSSPGCGGRPPAETYSFSGGHYTLAESPALPKPAQAGGPPIIIGGFGAKRTPRLAARYADEYNVPFHGVAETGEAFGRVRAASAEAGRTEPLVYSAAQVVCCGRDEAEIKRRADAIGREVSELRDNGLAGTPGELVDKIGRFGELGAERVYLQVLDMHDLDHLELLAAEVMSKV